MLELWQLALLTGLGIMAGWINVMAGGGSLLTVPMMVFMGLPGPVANGTNRLSIIAQNIVAVWSFFSKGFSDFKLSASLAVFACIGAFFGANLGAELSGVWFNRVLALVMIAILITMVTEKKKTKGDDSTPPQPGPAMPVRNKILGHILMIGVGFWGGFIQIGVGFLMMPVLYRVMGIDLVRTNMHKVFIALTFSIVALVVFAAKVDIAWDAGFALALGNALGGFLGARTAIAKGERWIKGALIGALVAMSVKLLFFS